MDYYIYPLRFLTPVHFGDTAQGGTLEDISITFSADSFFGACCSELSHNETSLASFVELVATNQIQMSSLFPYYQKRDEWEFYLPVPMMTIDTPDIVVTNFEETKHEATKQKKLKKRAFMRASYIKDFSSVIQNDTAMDIPNFVQQNTTTQVNMRGEQSRPYYVGNYQFAKGAGLYIIVGFSNDDTKALFDELIISLGLSGIGGKRSSGYGKFELSDDPILLDEYGLYTDDKALYNLITADTNTYLCISTCVPQNEEEIQSLKQGQYKVKKRSGFVVTEGADTQVKRNSYFSLVEGSTCPTKLQGHMLEIQSNVLPHKVYRNGLGFWIGVDVHE